MARVARLQDVSVPLSTRIPAYPGNPAFELQPIKRVAEGGSSNVSRRSAHRALLSQGVIIIEGLNLAAAESGVYEMYCLPLRLVGADGAPGRVVLRR